MTQITKNVLAASLKKLLLKKPLDKITITDLTEEAGINRMTFYYHFQDIYDLVAWVCKRDADDALKGKKTYATWQEGIINIFYAVLENKPFVLNVYRSVSRDKIEDYLYTLVYQLLYDVISEMAAGRKVDNEDLAKVADFYKYAFVGVMLDWVKRGMKEKPEDIISQLSKLVYGTLERSISNFID